MRAYTNIDVKGVEICLALKNIIALASGISTTLGYSRKGKRGRKCASAFVLVIMLGIPPSFLFVCVIAEGIMMILEDALSGYIQMNNYMLKLKNNNYVNGTRK